MFPREKKKKKLLPQKNTKVSKTKPFVGIKDKLNEIRIIQQSNVLTFAEVTSILVLLSFIASLSSKNVIKKPGYSREA